METLKGKIKWFNADKGYGFIARADKKADLFVHINQARDIPPEQLKEGLEVEFTEGQGKKGLEARNVNVLGNVASMTSQPNAPREHKPAPSVSKPAKPANGYHFLNPYNFVRYLDQPRPQNEIIGNCPPPPHDRYVGLTGRIVCAITPETPVFVSDSHAVEGNEGEHKSYRFFEYDGKPAIPASSLRGMVRGVFETITNSCWAVFDGARLPYRRLKMEEALMLVPAVVEPGDNGLRLRLMPGTDNGTIWRHRADEDWIKQHGRNRIQQAAWVRGWEKPLRGGKTFRENPNDDYTKRPTLEKMLAKLKHGQACYTVLSSDPVQHPGGRFRFWNVETIASERTTLEREFPGRTVVAGYLCKTNQNIENKHDERFFFRTDNSAWAETVDIEPEIQRAYNALIADYREQNKRDMKNREKDDHKFHLPYRKNDEKKTPVSALSPHLYDGELEELAPKQVVYVQLAGNDPKHPIVKYITPVMISRLAYNRKIGALVEQETHLHRCVNPNHLCPACRTFGWVKDQPKKDETHVAYAGRVRFSHAIFERDDLDETQERPLAILSSPKPTTTLFYLGENGAPSATVDYDSPKAQLRGRKFYRHQGSEFSWKEAESPNPEPSDQNRTLRGTLKTGEDHKSEFTVEFENLAPLELGALLWSLELEDGMFHRLGFAKPLGLGSVSIRVTRLEMLEPIEWYASIKPVNWRDILGQRETLRNGFFAAMQGAYGDSFATMLDDLRTLLKEPTVPHVHYPRPDCEPKPDGENFDWFIGNKQKQRQPLPLPKDDAGFPIWDRNGTPKVCK